MTIYLGRQEYQSEQPTKGYQPIKGNIGMHDGVVDIRFVNQAVLGKVVVS